MTEINEKTRISMEFKYMILSVIFMLSGVGGYYNLTSSVEQNTRSIKELTVKQEQQEKDYQQMNTAVIKLSETTRTIEKNTDEIKTTLEYLRRKSDE